MNYKVNLAALDNSFQVPNVLTDNFIKLANPKHILVLLWVLRHAETAKSAESISKELHMDKAVVGEAIFYWIDHGLMVPDGTAALSAHAVDTPAVQETAPPKKEKTTLAEKKLGSSMASDEDILQRASESAEFKFLLQKSQQIYGRTISKAERSMLLTLMDYYALPAEVILMLIKYAVLSGRTGTNYIQTVGISWAEEGIQTLEQAESKIKQLNKTNKLWHSFCERAGIAHKNPTKKQEALFTKWTKQWKMSVEVIACGYEKMLDSIDKVNYTYLDKIITSWHENGTTTLSQIEQAEQTRKAKGTSTGAEGTPSFSVDKFNDFLDNYELKYKKEEQ